jgi:hypothetical protein
VVSRDGGFAVAMTGGVDQAEQFPGPLGVSGGGERHDGPDGGVGVLPAVFADSGDVALDVAGIEVGFVEGRVEQLDDADVALDQVRVQRFERL